MAFRAFSPEGTTTSRSLAADKSSGGNKRALCVGINDYPQSPLGGCVSDARQWARWLEDQGFEVQTLLDDQATRRAILDKFHTLITSSAPGDTVVIQYAGHGTQVPDFSGDEDVDEALVPIDHRQTGYIIDDDIAAITDQIKEGVWVTFFMDCCHSGSNTRALFGANELGNEPHDVKVRALFPDEEMIAAHRRSREDAPATRDSRNAYAGRREVLFSACMPTEKALESGGQGHFTRAALQVLGGDIRGWSNKDFIMNVLEIFGEQRRQTPQLWSDDGLHSAPFLAGLGQAQVPSRPAGGSGGKDQQREKLRAAILELVKQLEKCIE